MADTLSNLEENSHSVFHTSPLTLLELSSMKIALHIWLEKYRKYGIKWLDKTLLDPDELQLHIVHKVPQKIRNTIVSCLDPITWELKRWYENSRSSFTPFSYDEIGRRFDLVVFGGDGAIHIRDTIANFFKEDSLSDEIKFKIACVHCVEEKVDFYWPLIRTYSRGFDSPNVFVRYWIDAKGGKVMRYPNRDMLSEYYAMQLRLGIKYFLALCNPEERFAQIADWFSTEPHWHLLPFIDSTSQRYVLDKFEIRVFQEFFKDVELCKYAVQAFLYVKDSLTIERFYNDVILYCFRIMNSEWYKDNYQYSMNKTLAELWFISPIDWRHRILNFHFTDILEKSGRFIALRSSRFVRNIGFLLAMLSDADAEFKKSFWMENWSKWIESVPPAQIEELMTLCLVETEVIVDFKRKLPDSKMFKYYCHALMSRGYHRKMNIFINTLYSNQEQAFNIKKHLLENEISVFFYSGEDRLSVWRKHSKYIDQVFSDPALAADFKYRLILSDNNIWDRLRDEIYSNRFNDVKVVVELFVPIHKIDEIRAKLLQVFRSRIVEGKIYRFDRLRWQNFLDWVLGQQQKEEFFKSLKICEIFEAAFIKLAAYHHFFDNDVQLFLIWYFNSESNYDNFKCERIQYYERMIAADFRKIFGKDKKFVIDLMKAQLK